MRTVTIGAPERSYKNPKSTTIVPQCFSSDGTQLHAWVGSRSNPVGSNTGRLSTFVLGQETVTERVRLPGVSDLSRLSPDGKHALVTDKDQLKLIDLSTLKSIASTQLKRKAYVVDWLGDAIIAVGHSVSWPSLSIWHWESGVLSVVEPPMLQLSLHEPRVKVSPQGHVAFAHAAEAVCVFQSPAWTIQSWVRAQKPDQAFADTLWWNNTGTRVIAVSDPQSGKNPGDSSMKLGDYDLTTGVCTVRYHSKVASDAHVFSPTLDEVFAYPNEETTYGKYPLQVFSVDTGEVLTTVSLWFYADALLLSRDGTKLFAGSGPQFDIYNVITHHDTG